MAEDNPFNQQVAKVMLEKMGLHMILANNGQKAIDLVQNNRADLILMDCQMPVTDGYDATIAIRQLPDKNIKHLPIVALTANAMSSDRQKYLDVGMNNFLSKPLTIPQLEAMLKRWICRSELSNQNQNLNKHSVSLTQQAEMMNDSHIDLSKLNAFQKLDPSQSNNFLKEILKTYLSSAAQSLSEIKQAIQNKNSQKLEITAHTLKSSSANIGAESLTNLCKELEMLGHAGKIKQALILLTDFQNEFTAVSAEIQKVFEEL